MADFDINQLRKDMNFIEDVIQMSNSSKKQTFELNSTEKASKKSKNLKYFLRKKRNILMKQAPTQMFHKTKLNTTTMENGAAGQRNVIWTVELAFIVVKKLAEAKISDNNVYTRIYLNNANMVNEETTLQSFINKPFLVSRFVNEEFNLFITALDEQKLANAPVYIKHIEREGSGRDD